MKTLPTDESLSAVVKPMFPVEEIQISDLYIFFAEIAICLAISLLTKPNLFIIFSSIFNISIFDFFE